jgi:hypothetical protein
MTNHKRGRRVQGNEGRLPARPLVTLLAGTAILAGSTAAFAYRPFDGTDAAVADVHEVEIELQPAGTLRQDSQTTLIAPHVVYNYGFEKNWELVVEGLGQFPLSNSDDNPSLADVGVFLKHVIREGSLQDAKGPSIAVEFGPLLPGVHADQGFGATLDTIVSQKWDWGTIHGNFATTLTRDHHADLFVGAIIEGPSKWKVRPVAEFFYEEEIGQTTTVSGLVGAIWQVDDKLSFDVAYRHALVNSRPVDEFRAGLTFGFTVPAFDGRKAK